MNQIDETWEQRMKSDLIDSFCATNHIIVSLVIRSSGSLVKFKQASSPTPHPHMLVWSDPSPCQLCLLEQSSSDNGPPSHCLLRTGPPPSVRLLLH